MAELDALDLALVTAAREHPRAGALELSRLTHVARATVDSRLRRLERDGVITGYGPDIDVSAAGFTVLAFVTLSIAQGALAAVQLRREDKAGQMWNLVGFQTRLRIPEQQRVFRTIPGLANAEFLRYGSIHRNSYINAPASLGPALMTKDGAPVFFAGQLTGVEGYTESIGTGLLAGINLARVIAGGAPMVPPPTTMLGGLYRFLAEADPAHFQPMNANFGLLDPIEGVKKADRKPALVARARADFANWCGLL